MTLILYQYLPLSTGINLASMQDGYRFKPNAKREDQDYAGTSLRYFGRSTLGISAMYQMTYYTEAWLKLNTPFIAM